MLEMLLRMKEVGGKVYIRKIGYVEEEIGIV